MRAESFLLRWHCGCPPEKTISPAFDGSREVAEFQDGIVPLTCGILLPRRCGGGSMKYRHRGSITARPSVPLLRSSEMFIFPKRASLSSYLARDNSDFAFRMLDCQLGFCHLAGNLVPQTVPYLKHRRASARHAAWCGVPISNGKGLEW